MSKETEEKVRHVISGYVTPLLVTIVGILVSVVGWFARDAYNKSMTKQDTLITLVQEVKTEQAVFHEKIQNLEKSKEDNTKDIAGLKTDLNHLQITIASLR